VPAAQLLHEAAPASETVPTAHATQAVDPTLSAYLPASQFVHELLAPKVPTLHDVHEAEMAAE